MTVGVLPKNGSMRDESSSVKKVLKGLSDEKSKSTPQPGTDRQTADDNATSSFGFVIKYRPSRPRGWQRPSWGNPTFFHLAP
jgi:hypothetical protein